MECCWDWNVFYIFGNVYLGDLWFWRNLRTGVSFGFVEGEKKEKLRNTFLEILNG